MRLALKAAALSAATRLIVAVFDALLQENGDFLLLEDGGHLLDG